MNYALNSILQKHAGGKMKKSLIGSTGAILVLVPGALLATPERNPFGYWYLSDQPAGWYYDAIVGLEREPVYTGSDRYEEEPELNARAIFRADSGHRYFISIGEGGAIFQLEDDLILPGSDPRRFHGPPRIRARLPE